jgi:hypothetical protein
MGSRSVQDNLTTLPQYSLLLSRKRHLEFFRWNWGLLVDLTYNGPIRSAGSPFGTVFDAGFERVLSLMDAH